MANPYAVAQSYQLPNTGNNERDISTGSMNQYAPAPILGSPGTYHRGPQAPGAGNQQAGGWGDPNVGTGWNNLSNFLNLPNLQYGSQFKSRPGNSAPTPMDIAHGRSKSASDFDIWLSDASQQEAYSPPIPENQPIDPGRPGGSPGQGGGTGTPAPTTPTPNYGTPLPPGYEPGDNPGDPPVWSGEQPARAPGGGASPIPMAGTPISSPSPIGGPPGPRPPPEPNDPWGNFNRYINRNYATP